MAGIFQTLTFFANIAFTLISIGLGRDQPKQVLGVYWYMLETRLGFHEMR